MNSQSNRYPEIQTSAGAGCGAVKPERRPDVPDQLDLLDAAVNRVDCAAKHLHERLQLLIRPVPQANGAQGKDAPAEIVCDIANHIRGRVIHLHSVADLLEYLAREVQL